MKQTPGQRFVIAHKKPVRASLEILAVCAIIAPPLIVVLSPVKMQDTWTAIMRVAGFLAYTLIFMNLVTGPLGRWFYILFNPKRVRRFHIATGRQASPWQLCTGQSFSPCTTTATTRRRG